jgi:ribonuclease HII
VDEAGRGPLAGPVVVAAVILNPDRPISGLADSKRLSEARRTVLARKIRKEALAWRVESIGVQSIDELNILQATLLGMRLAVERLDPVPDLALIDGNQSPEMACKSQTIVKGDQLEPAISAASILAKVHRDRLMCEIHEEFPAYGFNTHKGYPTPRHLEILQRIGPCPHHRRSYAPVRAALSGHPGPG